MTKTIRLYDVDWSKETMKDTILDLKAEYKMLTERYEGYAQDLVDQDYESDYSVLQSELIETGRQIRSTGRLVRELEDIVGNWDDLEVKLCGSCRQETIQKTTDKYFICLDCENVLNRD